MKKVNLKKPFLINILKLIQEYKTIPLECRETTEITINEVLDIYAKSFGYKKIKFIPTGWKNDEGKIYLSVKFQVDYDYGLIAYYNFSHFDKIIKSYFKE